MTILDWSISHWLAAVGALAFGIVAITGILTNLLSSVDVGIGFAFGVCLIVLIRGGK
jgi:hypothetical protein